MGLRVVDSWKDQLQKCKKVEFFSLKGTFPAHPLNRGKVILVYHKSFNIRADFKRLYDNFKYLIKEIIKSKQNTVNQLIWQSNFIL